MNRSFIALATNLTLCCTFLAAFLLKVNEELRQADPTNSFVQINPFLPTLVILIANFGVLAFVLGIVLQEIHAEMRRRNVRELLVFACSPTKGPLPEVTNEAQEVKDIMNTLATKSETKPCEVWHHGTADDLRRELISVPTRRFLFSGHAGLTLVKGECKTLGFTGPGGSIHKVEAGTLETLFGVSSANGSSRDGLDQLEFVFLNGCKSEDLGKAVCKAGVQTVVCWETIVDDTAARIFATSFFEAVAAGHAYRRAYKNAVLAMLTRPKPPYFTFKDPDPGGGLDTTEPQRGGSKASDEPKRSPGVIKKGDKYQIQLSIGQDAPQLKHGSYDTLEEANAKVAPFNALKDELKQAGMTNNQMHDELLKLKKRIKDRNAGARSALVPCQRCS